jgi:hypothetical protein
VLEAFGAESVTGRDLFALHLSEPGELPSSLQLPSSHFACLVAWDARGRHHDEIAAFMGDLVRAGASYICIWGPDCERVHDIADEFETPGLRSPDLPEDSVIMTTWHDDEPLEEALWFFLFTTWPDPFYESSTRSALAISVGATEWSFIIRSALSDPGEFSRRILHGAA